MVPSTRSKGCWAINSGIAGHLVLTEPSRLATDFNASQNAAGLDLLVRQATAGDEGAFSSLVDYFRPRLCTLLGKYLSESGSGLDAEDVVQETFVKAYQNLERYDSTYRFSTWLYTIAYRTARDHVRRDRRWSRVFRLFSRKWLSAEPLSVAESETRDQATRIWELAQSILTAHQYTALWLRYGEGLKVAEVAEIVGSSQGAVRVLLHRSRLAILEKARSSEFPLESGRSSTRAGADS